MKREEQLAENRVEFVLGLIEKNMLYRDIYEAYRHEYGTDYHFDPNFEEAFNKSKNIE